MMYIILEKLLYVSNVKICLYDIFILLLPKNTSTIQYMKTKFLVIILLFVSICSFGQYRTQTINPDIKTLRLRYLEQESLIRPILYLNDDHRTLEISFDELSHDVHQYTYTIYHLNKDWTKSDLSSFEYLIGSTTQDIIDYEHSLNTQQVYTHYRFTFPNEDMQLALSGNYVIVVYEDGNIEKTIAHICFSVVETIADIDVKVHSHTTKELNGKYQQVDIDINTKELRSNNPNEISLVVQQNARYDNIVQNPSPSFIEPNKLRFINHPKLIFEGGNEYRHFDAYSVYFSGYNVDKTIMQQQEFHTFLLPDQNNGISSKSPQYMHNYDNNGQFLINAERTEYDDTEAEYMWIHWFFPVDRPFMNGSIYIGGDIFNNQISYSNLMSYDAESKCYYLNSYLKQGAYDYQYWFVDAFTNKITLLHTEGSHWQTENNYRIFIYYRPIGSRYDRIVGYKDVYSSF